MVFSYLSRYLSLSVLENWFDYRRLTAATEHEAELNERNGFVSVANVQPSKMKEIGRLRRLQRIIKLKCIENLKWKRKERLLEEAESLAELETIRNEDIRVAHCRQMLAISKQELPRSRWAVLDVAYNPALDTSPFSATKREFIPGSAGGLGRIPTELLLLIVEHLPPQDQARLALTNSYFFERIGTQCWRTMMDRQYEAGRMEYLCSIEKDSKALDRVAVQPLACSHCMVFHDARRFDAEERVKEPMSRVCHLMYGEVEICNQLQLTWAEMLAIPENMLLRHYFKVKLPYSYFGEDSDKRYRPVDLPPAPGAVEVELMKIDSTLYVRTRYEFPATMKSVHWKNGFLYPSGGMSVSPCPHHVWSHFLHACKCKRNPGDVRCPYKCKLCKTEFEQKIEVVADGHECYVLTTWRNLGRDKDPMNESWKSQCHTGKFMAVDFLNSSSDRACRINCLTGLTVKGVMTKYEPHLPLEKPIDMQDEQHRSFLDERFKGYEAFSLRLLRASSSQTP